MAISIQCDCGRSLRLKDHLAGVRVKCPSCSKPIDVPRPGDVEETVFEILSQQPEAPSASRSQSYRPEYPAARPPAALPPPPSPRPPLPPKRRRRRSRSGGGEGFSISISPLVISGALMALGAVVWFVCGLAVG